MTFMRILIACMALTGASYLVILGTPLTKRTTHTPVAHVVTKVPPAVWIKIIDTSKAETIEGDLYTLTYDSARVEYGRPDPHTVYDLVYHLGDTVLAIMGDTAKWRGAVTLTHQYYADLDSCDWVTDTYVARFWMGKAHGLWSHTERYCTRIWVHEEATYYNGTRIKGHRLSTPED